jgi:hypothetical protein
VTGSRAAPRTAEVPTRQRRLNRVHSAGHPTPGPLRPGAEPGTVPSYSHGRPLVQLRHLQTFPCRRPRTAMPVARLAKPCAATATPRPTCPVTGWEAAHTTTARPTTSRRRFDDHMDSRLSAPSGGGVPVLRQRPEPSSATSDPPPRAGSGAAHAAGIGRARWPIASGRSSRHNDGRQRLSFLVSALGPEPAIMCRRRPRF